MSAVTRVRSRRLGRARFFAAAPGASVARRPSDIVLALTCLPIALLLALQGLGGSRDSDAVRVMRSFAGTIAPVWQLGNDLVVVWAVVVTVAAVARRQHRLLATIAGATVIVVPLTHLVVNVESDRALSLSQWFGAFGDSSAMLTTIAVRTALVAAALGAAMPALSRPYRRVSRVLLAYDVVAVITLAIASPSGALAGLAIGTGAAALAHLALGSPGGLPSVDVVGAALRELEIEASELHPGTIADRGAVVMHGRDGTGAEFEVFGRDAADGRFLASLWRVIWYRDRSTRWFASRVQQVEHEALMLVLAERLGVSVPSVATAGATEAGDALLVVRGARASIASTGTAVGAQFVDACWTAIIRLHDAKIAHRRIDASTPNTSRGTRTGRRSSSASRRRRSAHRPIWSCTIAPRCSRRPRRSPALTSRSTRRSERFGPARSRP